MIRKYLLYLVPFFIVKLLLRNWMCNYPIWRTSNGKLYNGFVIDEQFAFVELQETKTEVKKE